MRTISLSRLRSLFQPAAWLLAAGFGSAVLLAPPVLTAQQGGPDPGPIASQLPPLPVANGEVELPLGGDSPFAWVAIADGPATDHQEGQLSVHYTITTGRPAGAGLIFRAGTLDRLDRLQIEIRGNRSTQLVPTLRDTAGGVYRFPVIPVQVGSPRFHSLRVEEMQHFPGQAEGPDPGSFDPGEAILLSLIDISAFTGAVPAGTEIEWTVSSLTAVLEKESKKTAAATRTTARRIAPTARARRAQAEHAETRFFEVFSDPLGDRPLDRSAALNDLRIAFFSNPSDPRTALLLGLNYLWLVAERDPTDPRTIDFLVLAEHFLERAQRLAPDDYRIPSWLVPTQQGLASIDGDAVRAEELEAALLAAYAEDPDFHSFSVALAGFGSPRGSEQFSRGLRALRSSNTACPDDDPTCDNRPRWPHNLEGYLTFAADYELKAGNRDAARRLLREVQATPDYPSWPYRGEVEDRRANLALYADLYANTDPTDDPPALVINSRHSCQVCHRAE